MAAITILNPSTQQQESSGAGGNSAQAQLTLGTYAARGLVLVTATGSTNYQGPTQNAGMTLSLKVGGVVVSEDDSFEGESATIGFRSSVAHNFLLPANTTKVVEARVDHMGAGGVSNTNTKVTLICIVLEAAS